ncbi:MAG: hypothetical protein K5639_03995 [Eubacterium sp.]|nr:hypothetical protein [Eubacterium sp.]
MEEKDFREKEIEKALENAVVSKNYMFCDKCDGLLIYKGSGRYVCEDCDAEIYDEFGIIKKYLIENGPRNIIEISKETGVSRAVITRLLREGRLEVSKGSDVMPVCERCGIGIRFGIYCRRCADELGKERTTKRGVAVYNPLAEENTEDKMRFMVRKKLDQA